MKNVEKIAQNIFKYSIDVKTLDPKIQNRIKEMKKIYQQINEIQKTIQEQVSELQEQAKQLEKQAGIFEKQLMPTLKELEDHAIEAEGIFIELRKGKRSPKVGYEYLADKVTSELLMAAEEAITEAAKFAHSLSITVSEKEKIIIKKAGLFDWLKKQWDNIVSFIKNLQRRNNTIEKLISDLKKSI